MDKPIYIDRANDMAQRAATVLRDVSCVIEANFDLMPETIGEDFGIMLYDMDYSDEDGNIQPMFFRAVMKNGFINLRDWGC